VTCGPFRGCAPRESINKLTCVRRLYSTFAHGLPGVGLVLIRLAVGITACANGIGSLGPSVLTPSLLIALFHLGLGALIIIGLWTPVAGTLLALTAVADAYMQPAMRCLWALTGTVTAALTFLGPGRWSIDCRLYGWKSVKIFSRPPDPPT
jgi:putative oxidoreductase